MNEILRIMLLIVQSNVGKSLNSSVSTWTRKGFRKIWTEM